MISIIIPIYNEEKILAEHSRYFENLSQHAEFIFIDGSSTDASIDLASAFGKVLSCQKGRALQMNYGAQHARFDTIFFLHVDNIISSEALLSIEKEIQKNGIIGGCLTQRIDKNGFIYRIIEAQGNLRAKLSKIFYGDQGIFVKKDIFFKIGGFPEVPIMEDILFSKQLRKMGKTTVLPEKIIVSARRWERQGIIRTTLLFNLIIILFHLKVPLTKIKQLYRDLR
ncbi:MAG: TIGR04283 family arsenosugar biosynthesis glycosyltransferase [Candidatus Omnitrophota bacterium]